MQRPMFGRDSLSRSYDFAKLESELLILHDMIRAVIKNGETAQSVRKAVMMKAMFHFWFAEMNPA